MRGMEKDRRAEWFVPKWGPLKVRIFIGLLFLPYTGMVVSFVVIGSMLAATIHWDRVVAAVVVYFLGLGIAAHALDALGSKRIKPWGEHFSKGQLWSMAILSLILAYGIAIYYMVRYVPLLWIIAILEGFFVFAYNLEWFEGRFHTDGWFSFSWGVLPVLAGHILQTNRVSWASLVVAAAMGLLSYVEISASRPYKELKRAGAGLHRDPRTQDMLQYERILKGISLGVISLGLGLLVWRLS
jgi:hypothetical protein